jgi:tetratricopeptide (TPR) repeat protein
MRLARLRWMRLLLGLMLGLWVWGSASIFYLQPLWAAPSEAAAVAAQPVPFSPAASSDLWRKFEQLQQDKQLQELVERDMERSIAIRTQIQAEVDRAFSHTTALLNTLLAVLTALPVLAAFSIWVIRRSVLNQIISETKKQLRDEVEKQLEAEVAAELKPQAKAFQQKIEQLEVELHTQLEQFKTLMADMQKESEPDSPKAWFSRGSTLMKLQQFDDALMAYDKALQLQPDFAEAWLGRGIVLSKQQQLEPAIAALDRSLSLKPDLWAAWLSRARCHLLLGNRDHAIADLQAAQRLNRDRVTDALKTEALFEPLRTDERLNPSVPGNKHV